MVATEEPSSSSWKIPTLLAAAGAIGGAAVSLAAVSRARRSLVQLVQRNIEERMAAGFHTLNTQSAMEFQQLNRSIEQWKTAGITNSATGLQQIQQVNRNLEQLSRIFHSPKERGSFGETQLEILIRNALPPNGYEFQASLSNKKIADCVLRLPSPIGKLAVDSKFPLESFREEEKEDEPDENPNNNNNNGGTKINGSSANNNNNNPEYEARRLKQQKDSLRRHINDIAGKYIIRGETADCAILFLPSESIFRQVVTYHQDVWLESIGKRVWVTCPSTLMAIITTLQGVTRGLALQEQTEEMHGHVKKLTDDVDRLVDRFEKAEKSIDKAKDELRQMNISIEKIRKTRDAIDVMDGFLAKGGNNKLPSSAVAATAIKTKSSPPAAVQKSEKINRKMEGNVAAINGSSSSSSSRSNSNSNPQNLVEESL